LGSKGPIGETTLDAKRNEKKFNIVIMASGNGSNAENLIDFAKKNPESFEIKGIICDKEGAYVLERAKKHGIEAYLIPFVRDKSITLQENKKNHEKKIVEVIEGLDSNGEFWCPNSEGKIDSNLPFKIHMKPNFKIIDRLKDYSLNKKITLVGFKLTNTSDLDKQKEKVRAILNRKKVDFLVHNDLQEINQDIHFATLYKNHTLNGHEKVIQKVETKEELAKALEKILLEEQIEERSY
jgi:1-deoxy-D-xylulose 5-phosphate reductoisomerase